MQAIKETAKASLGSVYTCFGERFRPLMRITWLCLLAGVLVVLLAGAIGIPVASLQKKGATHWTHPSLLLNLAKALGPYLPVFKFRALGNRIFIV